MIDSFYVEARIFNPSHDTTISFPLEILVEDHWFYNTTSTNYFYPPLAWFDMKGVRRSSSEPGVNELFYLPDGVWSRGMSVTGDPLHGTPLVFPLLVNTCHSPNDVRVETTGSVARLIWTPGRFDRLWEISYGPAGTPPESGTVVQSSRAEAYITQIPNGVDYVAYIRAFCTARDSVWSPWSDSIHVRLHSSGIASADALGVTLAPNPAASTLHISSPNAALLSLDAYNSAGIRTAATALDGHSASLDLTSWPNGTYFLLLHTDLGPAKAPLVVKH
ncbi:MAG: T9SS type A sorting domain-containing protein [Bacteroidales bacterium]|nr:T9SS type A sorting domain-containing protein [Bacteroidales bacterium]